VLPIAPEEARGMRKHKETGARRHDRIDFLKPAFLIMEPNGPWFECWVVDISDGGVCIEVGALPVPKIFVLALAPGGKVRRACLIAWRQGELLGARFMKAGDIRKHAVQAQFVEAPRPAV